MRLILSSPISLIHVSFALVALVSGTYVLWQPKGTTRHRRVGYVFVGSMGVLLTTAFGIYHLFGRFGIVHWGAVACGLSLSVGVGAVRLRTRIPNWLLWHYLGLGGAVAGMYATFVVEATYRLFPTRYFWLTTVGTALLILLLAAGLLYRQWNTYRLPTGRETVASNLLTGCYNQTPTLE